jgi:hypothetical protein
MTGKRKLTKGEQGGPVDFEEVCRIRNSDGTLSPPPTPVRLEGLAPYRRSRSFSDFDKFVAGDYRANCFDWWNCDSLNPAQVTETVYYFSAGFLYFKPVSQSMFLLSAAH